MGFFRGVMGVMGFFRDGTGQLSMMRLLNFLVVVAILLVFIAVNGAVIYNSIKTSNPVPLTAMIDFAVQCSLLIMGVLGLKVAQGYFVEKKQSSGAEGKSEVPNG